MSTVYCYLFTVNEIVSPLSFELYWTTVGNFTFIISIKFRAFSLHCEYFYSSLFKGLIYLRQRYIGMMAERTTK